MRRAWVFLVALSLGAWVANAAITAPGPAQVSYAEIERYRESGVPADRWPALMETLGSEEQTVAVRELIKGLKPFPSAKLVELLSNPRLATRLGALELLEEAAGESFDFDPWQDDAADGPNEEALKRWKEWATKGAVAAVENVKLTDETFRVIAQEITGGKPERAERAMRRLSVYGTAAIAPIEAFLQSQTNLEEQAKAMLKQVEYRIVIGQTMPRQAAALARDLTLGSPEAQSTAVAALGQGGSTVLPVLREFLQSPDPLVRETAVDAAFTAGGKASVPMIIERVDKETAESVIHSMLRGMGKYGASAAEAAAIIKFIDHPSENVVVGAIEALGFNKAGNPTDALKKALKDSRWRVRAAALETIGKRALSVCEKEVAACLQDPDMFARGVAAMTLMQIAPATAEPVLLEQFEKQHELKAPILRAFFSARDKNPPDKLWNDLQKAPPEVILQCLETLISRDDYQGKRVVFAVPFANHPNRDVSASALRILASKGRSTGAMLEALKGSDDVKRDAVLDELHLPDGFFGSSIVVSAPPAAANPKLETLYQRMRVLGGDSSKPTAPTAAQPAMETSASPKEMAAVLHQFLRTGTGQQQMRAALLLADGGDSTALDYLAKNIETLAPVDRRMVAGTLKGVDDWTPVLPLATRLLRDPADDVRETMTSACLAGGKSQRITLLLNELSQPQTKVNPSEFYGWEFDQALKAGTAKADLQAWVRRTLAESNASDSSKAFALIVAPRVGEAENPNIEALTRSPNMVLRRAAYWALGLAYAEKHLDSLLKDESALVRMVLPFLASPVNGSWLHYFDEVTTATDSEDHSFSSGREQQFGAWAGKSNRGSATASDAVITSVEKLARDPVERVRLEAMFSLLRMGRPVDPSQFSALLAAQPADAAIRRDLGRFLERNYARLGKGYGVLLPVTRVYDENAHAKARTHFGLNETDAPTSFAALAKLKPVEAKPADNQIAAPGPVAVVAQNEPFRVLFFFKVGCRECERVREMLSQHVANFKHAQIEELNIDDSQTALLNEALSARFQLRDTLHQVTPAVFTQKGALVKEAITFPALGDLLRDTESLPREKDWAKVETTEVAAAQTTIEQRYSGIGWGVVGLAGLLDGINPCAFATIIFLLSYLHVARRSPGEVLAVGAAFISAVFLSYFLVGLGLLQVVAKLDGMRVAGTLLNYALAGFALILALFSFRDAQLASRGQFGEMTLQLPGAIKEQIRSTIRTSAKASRFVLAAFVAGVVISFLELACTGQVYLPTILYMLRAGHSGAMGQLLLYNVAFVLPLIVVFGLAWTGMRSDALVRFQQRNVALVKVLTGILFIFLTLFLLFGHLVIPQLGGTK